MKRLSYPNQLTYKALLGLTPLFFVLTGYAQTSKITVDATRVLNKVPAKMYGSCIEDVNHEIYGGLYDQRLYGESFEEPAPSKTFAGWTAIKGDWKSVENGISVNAGEGYKLIRENPILTNGSVETDIKFGRGGNVAGLIASVNNAQAGADDFDGYEVSLAPGRQAVVLGKHRHNWQALKEVKATFDRAAWNHLKVTVNGAHITIYLNNEAAPVIDYTDESNPLPAGKIGLRTYNANVQFKNVVISQGGNTLKNEFTGIEPAPISGMWDAITTASAKAKFTIDTTGAYNGQQAQVIEYLGGAGKVGLANNGLNRWGIGLKAGQKFQGYVFLKAEQLSGPVSVSLQNAGGTKTYASYSIPAVTGKWAKYPFILTSTATDKKARFTISIAGKGKLTIDQAMLMSTGKDQFKGLPLRADIATNMQDEGLNFVRYGGTMVNAPDYKWKNMVGRAEQRPPYNGHWYPYTSNGFGINEFVGFCEAAGFDAAFAINVEETPQDVADMLEYLTGPATTTWGKKRAEAGHPLPYKLKYIELGNEEVIWGDLEKDYRHYAERFNLLYDVIHSKNPEIKVICAAWWRPKSPNMELVFKAINGKADYWDLHTDADEANAGTTVDHNLQNMQDLFLKWDANTKMKITIFEENGGLHNQQRALGHATTMNAVRRHGDFVLTSCAANGLQALGQNDNGWDQGQIFYTPLQVWGMPPFYATQMAAKNHLPNRVFDTVDGDLDVTATKSDDGNTMVLHVINTKPTASPTVIDLKGFDNRKPSVKVYTLADDLKAENTPALPEKTSTKETVLSLPGNSVQYNFPAHSYTILRFNK